MVESKPVESMEVEPTLPEVKQEVSTKVEEAVQQEVPVKQEETVHQETEVKEEAPAKQETEVKEEVPAKQETEAPTKQEPPIKQEQPQITPLSTLHTLTITHRTRGGGGDIPQGGARSVGR